MARATYVKKARTDIKGGCGKCGAKIKKGQSYVHWSFRISAGKSYISSKRIRCGAAKCRPRSSDLTQSPFYGSLYSIQELIEDACGEFITNGGKDDLVQSLRDAAEGLRSLGEEQREKFDNMPEGLQQGDTGQTLEQRADECEGRADELEQAADEIDSEDEITEDEEVGDTEEEDSAETESDWRQRIVDIAEGVDLSIG